MFRWLYKKQVLYFDFAQCEPFGWSIRNSNIMNPCVLPKLARQHKLEVHGHGAIGA